jgi:hypothetical protein
MKANKTNRCACSALMLLAVLLLLSINTVFAHIEYKITANDGSEGDDFGSSVSISDDFTIVGAMRDDDNGDGSGSAYIFFRDDDDWIQQEKIVADDGDEGDWFGNSVSISGDYAIVGAFRDGDHESGSAYIFILDGEDWVQQVKITADDRDDGDNFGSSVSICGDYAIVGAHDGDDENGDRSGSAYIFVRDGEDWVQQAEITAEDGAEGDWFGTSVSIEGDYAIVGACWDDDNGGRSGSAYIFIRDDENWIQQEKITANDGAEGDSFGNEVSINSDYAIVGARWDDDNGSQSGSAYIFVRDGENWIQQEKITADDGSERDNFGTSVSIDGDYAIVGAFWDDENGGRSGSAYFFVRDDENWIQQEKIVADDGDEGDWFGNSVFISGDYAIVGAVYDDNGEESGSAYIYWLFEEEPSPDIAFNPETLNFGGLAIGGNRDQIVIISNNGDADLVVSDITTDVPFSVAFDGEFVIAPDASREVVVTFSPEEVGGFEGELTVASNDPDANRVVLALIGSCGDPDIAIAPEALDFGAVIVDQIGEQTITITNEGNADLRIDDLIVEGAYFSVDFNDEIVIQPDGEHELVVTFAPEGRGEFDGVVEIVSDDPDEAEVIINLTGSAVILLLEEQRLNRNDIAAFDYINGADISGNYAIIGSRHDDDDGDNSGSAYIFVREVDNWSQQSKLTADDAEPGDQFGTSVAISGDYAIVGAYFEDPDDIAEGGSAYIYHRTGEEWSQQAKLNDDDTQAGDNFGHAVSICGDYTIVGTHIDANDNRPGSACIFHREGENWIQQVKIEASDGEPGNFFGHSVSVYGDYVIVGAYDDSPGGVDRAGSAYIFHRSGEEWIEQEKIVADDGDELDLFGTSVSIWNDYVLVGAQFDEGPRNIDRSGSAYIFQREGENWTQQAKIRADDGGINEYFGSEASICGDNVVVGARFARVNGLFQSGAAYLFHRSGNTWTQLEKLVSPQPQRIGVYGGRVSINDNYALIAATHEDFNGLRGAGVPYVYQLFDRGPEPDIAIDPEALDFGAILVDQIGELIITISNEGDVDLRIDDIIVEDEYFRVNFENEIVIEPDAEVEVVVTFALEGRGVFEGILRIFSNDPNQEETLVALSGSGDGLTITLRENWNLISINVSPPEEFYEENDNRGPDVILMMEQLRIDEDNHHVLLMKNEDGQFYMPSFDFNNIPYWDLTEGYQVKVDQDVEAIWIGEPIPSDSDIWLDEGWNIIAYFPTYNLDASSPDYYVLSPIIDVVEMAKNNIGRFMTPEFNFSNMPPWRETQGYQVKVTEDVLLNYPPIQEDLAFSPKHEAFSGDNHWVSTPTGQNMSVLIATVHGIDPAISNQIAAFNTDGKVIGSGTVTNDGKCGLAVWGDDESTDQVDGLVPGEAFTLKLWEAKQDKELTLSPINTLEGEGLIYEPDGLKVIEVATESAVPDDYFLSEAYPNPFNASVRLGYGLPEASDVTISVYDINGRLITILTNGKLTAGYHSVVWDGSATASGIYFVRMFAGEFKSVRKVTLVK